MEQAPHIQDLIRIRRRTLLAGVAGLPFLSFAGEAEAAAPAFANVPPDKTDVITVPPGYRAQTLIAWGDPLFDTVGPFNPDTLTRAEQEKRFGQNNDMLALFPARYAFPPSADQSRMILCANNEYADRVLAFPSVTKDRDFTDAQKEALFAAIGVSIVQIEKQGVDWRVIKDARPGSGFNRRVTPFTPVAFSGPAKSHRWINAASTAFRAAIPNTPTDSVPCGTLANCAGGQTPWGTYLTAEENFDGYFAMSSTTPALAEAQGDAAWLWASGNIGNPLFSGSRSRGTPAHYDVARVPYGPALYGWVVEIDPYEVNSTPKKRTSLGRFKHECATTALARDGRVVVYSGDDQAGEFVYKFVSRGRFDAGNRAANKDLLDDGQLYVAKFEANGTGRWIALTPQTVNANRPGYTAEFVDAGDVVIRAREAARCVGATPMDRPEDVEAIRDANWVGQGPVLVVCTNNRAERPAGPGNPQREAAPGESGHQSNLAGHILRIDEHGNDCGATRFRWDVFALGGDPDAASPVVETPQGPGHVSVRRNGAKVNDGARFACPDNICFDAAQNVWIATDGSPAVFNDCNDSVLVAPTGGTGPRPVKRFLVGPIGAEICGPTIAPDQRAFLVSIQHPGESDAAGNSFSDTRWENPSSKPGSSFPDGNGAWPRSSVVVITRTDGGVVGT